MIQVWTGSHDGHQASGVLDRNGASGSTFAYTPPPPHAANYVTSAARGD